MIRSPYATSANVHCIEGRVGTGKTQFIVDQVADLLHQEVSPRDIALFAATPAAARALEERLAKAIGAGACPRVSTLPLFSLELLGSPKAVCRTGRRGRTLMRFEENLLMEDMKTSGVAPRRLGEMLKFLYRSMTDLEPLRGDWFYDEQEARVFQLLCDQLAFREAYLACELPRAAWDYLGRHDDAREAATYDHVFVDDYQMASRASQCLAGAIARTSLTVAHDPLARVRGSEDYPAFKGAQHLLEANPDAEIDKLALSRLSCVVTDAVNRFAEDEAIGDATPLASASGEQGVCEAVAYERPEDELQGIVTLVAYQQSRDVAASDIAVAAANRLWAANAARALRAQGIPVSPLSRVSIAGDTHDEDACRAARAFTLLRLVADRRDPLALRSWCGFGDYLANSALMTAVVAGNATLSLEDGVTLNDQAPSPLLKQGAERADAALAEARQILGALDGLLGSALVEAALEAAGAGDGVEAAALKAVAAEAPPTASAAELCHAVERAVLMPQFAGQGVRVGLPEDFAGQSASAVVMAGLVNGLTLPRRYFDPAQVERDKRPALLAAEMAKTYACAGKAASALLLTYFSEAPLATAESLKLKIHRVRLREGERLCEVRPSETIRAITGVSYHD
ncbi:UvrD-helicase domain-containing protein [Adlercreutzia sp. R21]|uniref:UvrD-helicase domain-containing protein n=1 Tax=Adlercreutzia wanghongyangiae TaxID=3111451 RepID=UPI002DBBECC9|nr:UvrD-helicase domain-containing protein [Adlercreutzia sp. R21]MEC4183568.1 UvrD-helicase domain-containing protein [Adlercreutzia sp. R21]